MHSPNFTIPARNIHSSRLTRPGLFIAAITAARWLARKINERRNRNALMELSDEQLKDIGLSRGQTESDVHVYSRY
ncbi:MULTISPECIES: DUF1127 domain-containing protein [Rhizobium]|uniref:DUF1127 domain-containing protein n=1 Tax=Rhizobium TaxID=379 RepID=UPI001C8FD25E|nr:MULTISPECIES: DUF1127 domain-containing protein [Rhizobium]MBY3175620.1 DUF1127 domain-containing protein [Rhizobium leguminosarum]MBY3207322.1 DUF1127 domain-containing protein [Rhizobium laguerreae]MBY3216108.1 DUF1127 domain-containing protein [Rhizobium laguerreae]MBY3385634.1 DUF1127 domain-containing protein [Rhizobium laguerreae]MBY3399295.1 DUF1127 domain-containing protein [Rhizobium laguerreae]